MRQHNITLIHFSHLLLYCRWQLNLRIIDEEHLDGFDALNSPVEHLCFLIFGLDDHDLVTDLFSVHTQNCSKLVKQCSTLVTDELAQYSEHSFMHLVSVAILFATTAGKV